MTAILAVGSPFGADNIGWQIATQLNQQGFQQVYCCRHPIDLLAYFQSDKHCIVIDALCSDRLSDGELVRIQPGELKQAYCANSHGLTLYEVIQLAGISGQLPEQLDILGINISKRGNRIFSDAEVDTLVDQLCAELSKPSSAQACN